MLIRHLFKSPIIFRCPLTSSYTLKLSIATSRPPLRVAELRHLSMKPGDKPFFSGGKINQIEQFQKSTGLQEKNKIVLRFLIAGVVFALALSYASVPLYRIYCQKTGKGGKAARIEDAVEKVASMEKNAERVITVEFTADRSSAMAWDFKPTQPKLVVCVICSLTWKSYITQHTLGESWRDGARVLYGQESSFESHDGRRDVQCHAVRGGSVSSQDSVFLFRGTALESWRRGSYVIPFVSCQKLTNFVGLGGHAGLFLHRSRICGRSAARKREWHHTQLHILSSKREL